MPARERFQRAACRVLAIPPKRTDRPSVTFLRESEIEALLAAPDQDTRTSRRDHALLLVAIQCGLRISELIALSRDKFTLGPEPTSPVPERDASNGPRRWLPTPLGRSGVGSTRHMANPPIRSFPAVTTAGSAGTPSNTVSPSTSQRPGQPGRRSAAANGSPPTHCVTPAQWVRRSSLHAVHYKIRHLDHLRVWHDRRSQWEWCPVGCVCRVARAIPRPTPWTRR